MTRRFWFIVLPIALVASIDIGLILFQLKSDRLDADMDLYRVFETAHWQRYVSAYARMQVMMQSMAGGMFGFVGRYYDVDGAQYEINFWGSEGFASGVSCDLSMPQCPPPGETDPFKVHVYDPSGHEVEDKPWHPATENDTI